MRKADNLPPSCAVVMKSGNLNFLEPSGLLRACNGTALPLPFYIKNVCFPSVQNLLSSTVLSKNIQTEIHSTVILPLVLYGSET